MSLREQVDIKTPSEQNAFDEESLENIAKEESHVNRYESILNKS
jgi:hypothetical protein